MITGYFLNLPYYFISFLIGLLPASQGFPPEILAAAQTIGGQIGMFEPVFPTGDLAAGLAIVSASQIGVWSWKTFKWVVSHIPWFGGKG